MAFKLFLALTFVSLGRPQDLLAFLVPLRPALVLTVVVALVLFFGERSRRFGAVFSLPETKRYVLFYFVMILGIPFALHKGLAFETTFRGYLPNMLFFLIMVSEIDSQEKLKKFLGVVCISAFIYSFVGGILKGGDFKGDSGRFQLYGDMFDANDTAFVLVSLLPLSLFYLRLKEGRLKSLFSLATVCASIAVILMTGSRGGFLGLAAMLATMLLTKAGGIKKGHKVAFLILLAGTAYVMRDSIDVGRYLTLTDISSDYNVTKEGGRLDLWRAAMDFGLSHPLTGIGAECFAFAMLQLREANAADYLGWQHPHNSFLQIFSELGFIGFGIFAVMIVSGLATFLRVGRVTAEQPEATQLGALSGLMFLGFAGLLVTSFFLTQGYSIYFTLYFGLAAVMRRLQAQADEVQVRDGKDIQPSHAPAWRSVADRPMGAQRFPGSD